MVEINMNEIYNFVGRFAGAKLGKPASLMNDIELELQEIHQKYHIAEQTLDVKKANNNQEWQAMVRLVQLEYAPCYQAWTDKHKLDYQFKMDPPH